MADRLVSEETLAAGQDKESRAQSKVIMKKMIMMVHENWKFVMSVMSRFDFIIFLNV